MKKATHDVVELGLGVKMESMVQEKDKDITNHLLSLFWHMRTPVCLRHAQAGMAAIHSSASKTFSSFLSFD